jgi:hypothetical protein
VSTADEYIERLGVLSLAEEQRLLDEVLAKGFDQGCILDLESTALIADVSDVERVFDAASERPLARAAGQDAFPEGRDVAPIPSIDSPFVVVSQRCDLVTGLRLEPLVEVVRATSLSSESDQARAARMNSARLIPLAEQDSLLWAGDLRVRGYLPKDLLVRYPACQVVPSNLRARFRLRLGQRYSRDALPADLVATVQRPLIGRVIGRNATTRQLASVFTDWLLYPDEGRYRLLAVVDPAYSKNEGDDAYNQLSRYFPDELEALLTDASGAIVMEQLNFLLWLGAMKINLDEISWHETKGEGHSEPTR